MRADSPGSSQPGFRLVLLTGDAVLIVAALSAITLARGGSFDAPDIVLALTVFSLKYAVGLGLGTGFWAGFKPILMNWTLIVSILLGLGYVTNANVFDPMVVATCIVSVSLILYAGRRVPMFLSRRINAKGCRKAVIVGATESGRKLAQKFVAKDLHRVKVVGFFDSRDVSRLDNVAETPVIGGLAALPEFVKANEVRSVYIALPMSSQPRILKLLDDLGDTTASIYFVLLITDMMFDGADMEER